jgi:hypothetical protein
VTDSQIDKQSETMLARLREIGGASTKEDDLIFEGTKVVLPQQWNAEEGVKFLRKWIESQEATARFERKFKYRPNDGAAAVSRALRTLFGTAGIGRPIFSMFGVQYPPVVTIDIGYNVTDQVSTGWLDLPHLDGRLYIGETSDDEIGTIFYMIAEVPKKHGPIIDGLFKLIEDELRKKSIYKGQAVNGAETPQYINPYTVDPSKVVYAEDVDAQLEANIWTPIRHTDRLRSLGVPLKRSVLLAGPFGTGKSLAAMLTAQIAVEHGWTFLQVRPGDELGEAMQTAVLYSPTVVFYEDVDTIAQDGDPDAVANLLDMFDGIGAKGTDVMVVLTTNHVERIHKGMLRPGRLDAVVEIAHLDTPGVERLVKCLIPSDRLSEDIDWERVHTAMKGYLPAFIKEAAERALRYAIARNEGEIDVLQTDDLVYAAEGLRTQYNLMNEADEGAIRPSLDRAFTDAVDSAVENRLNGAKMKDTSGDNMYSLAVTDSDRSAKMYGH